MVLWEGEVFVLSGASLAHERTDSDAWLFRAYVAGQSRAFSLAHGALTLEVDRLYARVLGTRNADASSSTSSPSP